MNEEIMSVFIATVAKRAQASNNTSWGGDDSTAVIEAIVDAAYLGDKPEGFDTIRETVKELANPSAFRQKLEKLPKENSAHIVKSDVKRGGASMALGLLQQLGKGK